MSDSSGTPVPRRPRRWLSAPRGPAGACTGVRTALAACLVVLAAALAGCAQQATAAQSIEVSTAYVNVPTASGTTEAYLDIRNNGSADRLTSASTSVGGVVTFRSPATRAGTVVRTVPDIVVPARTLMRLNPDSYHMLISKPGKMVPGTEITLTLVFAKAGPISVTATVTDPETGGNSYLGD